MSNINVKVKDEEVIIVDQNEIVTQVLNDDVRDHDDLLRPLKESDWELEEDIGLVDNLVIQGVSKKCLNDVMCGKYSCKADASNIDMATSLYRSFEPMKRVMRTEISKYEFDVIAVDEARRLGIKYVCNDEQRLELIKLGRKRALVACLENELFNDCGGGSEPISAYDRPGMAWLGSMGLPVVFPPPVGAPVVREVIDLTK